MKFLIPVLPFFVMVPGAAEAQLGIDLSRGRPVLRANVAGILLSAGVDERGELDVRLNESRVTRTSAPATRTPRRTTTAPTATTGRARATADAVLATGDQYVGTRYVWGGESPSGFDCSGFVQYVFRRHGIELPRTSRQQAQVGQTVSRSLSALEVGDLMFFASNGSRIDHIAIYAGDNTILHSSSSGGGVGYDKLSTQRGQWFVSHHVATRRVISDGYSLVAPLTSALRAITRFDPPDRAPRR